MGDVLAGYNAVHTGFYTFAQNFFEPAIFIPFVLVVTVVGVAVMVVMLDGDPHQHGKKFLDASYPLLYVIPILLFAVWFFRGGANLLLDVASHTWNIILIVVGFFTALIAIVLMLIFPLVLVVCYVVLGYSLVRGAPHLARVLLDASVVIGRGLEVVVNRLFQGFRAVIYFFVYPPALRDIKRVLKNKEATHKEIFEASRKLREEYQDARANDTSYWKKPTIVLDAHLHHYRSFLSKHRLRVLNEYTKIIGETAEELQKESERRTKSGNKRNP